MDFSPFPGPNSKETALPNQPSSPIPSGVDCGAVSTYLLLYRQGVKVRGGCVGDVDPGEDQIVPRPRRLRILNVTTILSPNIHGVGHEGKRDSEKKYEWY